jgi:hypothetical protein
MRYGWGYGSTPSSGDPQGTSSKATNAPKDTRGRALAALGWEALTLHNNSDKDEVVMNARFDVESVDMDVLRAMLERACGPFVEGEVVGRTTFRDEVTRHLGCSSLEAERIVDTMVGRGFLRRETVPDGRVGWSTRGAG